MNANSQIGRRAFLNRTSGALGCLALGGTLVNRPDLAAEPAAPGVRRSRAALEQLIQEMEPDGPPWLTVPRADGLFLSLLVRATRARQVLELGTMHGYAAIWMAWALEDTGGHLTTVEILPDRVAVAKRHVARASLDGHVTFKEGDAHQIVPALAGPFDLVFLNADKGGQVDYFQTLFPKKLSAGALLVANNAIKLRDKMKDYLELVGQHPEFDTVTLSCTMDDGFALSLRKGR